MHNRQYWRSGTSTSRKQHKVHRISWKIQWYWPVGAESAIHHKAKGNDVGAAVCNFETEENSFFHIFQIFLIQDSQHCTNHLRRHFLFTFLFQEVCPKHLLPDDFIHHVTDKKQWFTNDQGVVSHARSSHGINLHLYNCFIRRSKSHNRQENHVKTWC